MKLDWRFHERKELEYDKPPSVWIAVVIIIVTCVAGAVLTVLTWEKGQPVISVPFFNRAVLAPLALSGCLCSLLYTRHENSTDVVYVLNYLGRQERVRWQAWSQSCIAMLESVTLTPEKDLAERMLGLEGSEPRNEGKLLRLHANEDSDGEADVPDGSAVVLTGVRLEAVLEKLITPFVPHIARAAVRHAFSILLQSDDEEDIVTLRTVLRRLDIPDADRIGIERATQPFDAGLVHRWLNDEEKMPDFCLVLACQLHHEGTQARFSEVAVGVLFASEYVGNQFKGNLKAQAYFYQPISAASDSVAIALPDMFKAQRMPPESVQHLWLSALPRQARHAAVAAASGAGLTSATHDVELAIGVAGPANALLAQALAAEMVQHGQGTQLVATSGGAGIVFNLIGPQRPPAPAEPAIELRYLGPFRMLGAACFCGLMGCFMDFGKAPGVWYLAIPFLYALIMISGALGVKGQYEEMKRTIYGRSS